MGQSECCDAPIITDDICSKCKEHCESDVKVCEKCDGYGWVSDTTLKGYKDCDNCNKTGSK